MTIKQILAKYKDLEIEILLSAVLSKPREFLYLNGENRLTRRQIDRLTRMVKQRLKGEPIAYVVGYKDFMGLRVKVNKHTLIPRPETEEMVERVLNVVQGRALLSGRQATGLRYKGTMKVLDVGTGTGCIAISLAKYLKISNIQYQISASDISLQALKNARQNAKKILGKNFHTTEYRSILPLRVKFIKSDLLENVKGNFDVIVANLPYVPDTDYKKLKNNLKFEPKNAIFAKENGLEIIVKLLNQIASLKYQPKFIYLEFDPRQKIELSKLIKKTLPFYKAEFFKDLNNFWRFVEIKHSNILQNALML